MKWLLLICSLFAIQLCLAELRDPTRPEGYAGQSPVSSVGSLELNQVIVSPQRNIAVINGQIVEEGGEIAGTKVISIHENSVQLQSTDGITTLFLVTTPVKQQINHS